MTRQLWPGQSDKLVKRRERASCGATRFEKETELRRFPTVKTLHTTRPFAREPSPVRTEGVEGTAGESPSSWRGGRRRRRPPRALEVRVPGPRPGGGGPSSAGAPCTARLQASRTGVFRSSAVFGSARPALTTPRRGAVGRGAGHTGRPRASAIPGGAETSVHPKPARGGAWWLRSSSPKRGNPPDAPSRCPSRLRNPTWR